MTSGGKVENCGLELPALCQKVSQSWVWRSCSFFSFEIVFFVDT